MKRYLLVGICLFLCAGIVSADDLHIKLKDSISAADTVANAWRYDTAYSTPAWIKGWNTFHFYVTLAADVSPWQHDTNWADDTFFVDFQHSFDQVTWYTVLIDTLLDNGSARDEFVLKAADSVIGNWARSRLIHRDKMEAAAPIKNNVYYKDAAIWIAPKQ